MLALAKVNGTLKFTIEWDDGLQSKIPAKRIFKQCPHAVVQFFAKYAEMCDDFEVSTRQTTKIRERFRVKNIKVVLPFHKIISRRMTVDGSTLTKNSGHVSAPINKRRVTFGDIDDNYHNQNDEEDGENESGGNRQQQPEPVNLAHIMSLFKPKKVPFNYRRPSSN